MLQREGHHWSVGALVLVYLSCTLFLNFLIGLHLLFGLPLVYTQNPLSATEDLLLPSSKSSLLTHNCVKEDPAFVFESTQHVTSQHVQICAHVLQLHLMLWN